MARGLGDYARDFVRNWRRSDAPFGERVRMTLRNRSRSLSRGGCCGHPGEPGC
jgi:hypothetical protein